MTALSPPCRACGRAPWSALLFVLQERTKVLVVVNPNTAKALGLTVPESVLYRVDEVIR